MFTISDIARKFYLPVDRTGVENCHGFAGSVQSLSGYTEGLVVFPQCWKEIAFLSFKLNTQHIQSISISNCFIEVVIQLHSKIFHEPGYQGRGTTHGDSRSHCFQPKNVRPRHATVGHITNDTHMESFQGSILFPESVDIQQCLRWVLMGPISCIDNICPDNS